MYLRNGTNAMLASKLILNLDLVVDLVHKVIFYNHIRLKVIAQVMQDCVKQAV